MRLPILSIRDVAEGQLCCGCGACAAVDPAVEMVDDLAYGRRPLVRPGGDPARAADALRVCPGVRLEHDFDPRDPALIHELTPGWGPIVEIWEGHASDEAIRLAGSSGGAATALALYCIERGGMHGALHIAAREDVPWLNRTVLSRTRDELLERTGSRYAPASPCDGLAMVEEAPGPCVFIGKPCDAAAVRNVRRLRPGLDRKIGVSIAFFCAGAPSSKGTLEMFRAMGVPDPSRVRSVRYRGNGWPGLATVVFENDAGDEETRTLTYAQSWGDVLQKHRQWRCYICPDHTGEFADIAVGDPWYRPVQPGEPGESLVLARTERGRSIVRAAMEAGYLSLRPATPEKLPASQMNLLRVRGSLWGRLLFLRLLGAPAPVYRGMPMFRFWLTTLSLKEKARSTIGTARRVFRKRLRERVAVTAMRPVAARPVSPERAGGR